ncbi:MAG TPA: L-dopachrome tautomerase-related protein [Solirubrobacteraceae bacterium]|nr:L-dopachrome tautomerase-related protein [Solirubrobacteraceae bacterium]
MHADPPYPDLPTNVFDDATAGERLVSVQSVVVDPLDRLWLLDTGSIEMGPTKPGGSKLSASTSSATRSRG